MPKYALTHIRIVEDSIGEVGKSGLWGGRFRILGDNNIWIQDLAGG